MLLNNLLSASNEAYIEYRCNSPFGSDMLFGFAEWDGQELKSSDGDSYYLNEEIEKYEWEDDHHLTIWIFVEWG